MATFQCTYRWTRRFLRGRKGRLCDAIRTLRAYHVKKHDVARSTPLFPGARWPQRRGTGLDRDQGCSLNQLQYYSMIKNIHILIVDDEPEVRAVLRNALEGDGFSVIEASNRDDAIRCVDSQSIDLVTLDLRLGQEDGLDLAREIRTRRNIPIVMITGRDAPLDRVTGLEHGADDYITKPFHIREVVLRLQNVLMRYAPSLKKSLAAAGSASGPRQFAFDKCVLDLQRRELRLSDGTIVDLTDIEFRLLALLLENPARVLSRDEISHSLTGRDWSPLDRSIDGHIARLRRKLEAPAEELKMIKSVRGVGYVFAADVSAV